MLAYQQLSMERYKDALVEAGLGTRGNELAHRSAAGMVSVEAALQRVVPALGEKEGVFDQMKDEHSAYPVASWAEQSEIYRDFSAALDVMQRRLAAQRTALNLWATDNSVESMQTPQEDFAERQALDKALRD
jgi:hypothetical protein